MARGALPKYRAIADDLERRVRSGEFSAGDQLPSQAALAGEYRVTIMTLRQAVAELERDGLVRAAPGKGTFVTDAPTVSFGLDRLSSFAQEMAQQGVDVETEVLTVEVPADERDAGPARRAVEGRWDGLSLTTLVRRRSIDGIPVVVQRSTMPDATWGAIRESDLADDSLYDALARRAGHAIERAAESFRAVLVTGADAELLGVPDRSAALESTRVSFDADGPFLVDRALMLGSATEVRAERTADDLRLGYSAS